MIDYSEVHLLFFIYIYHNPFLEHLIIDYTMSQEKMTLPFEVTYSEKPSKKSKNMKRLAVIVKPESLDETISSLKEMGLDSTIYDVKRATKEKKERVGSGRGSGTLELAYTARKIVATVVNSDDVDMVIERMKKALSGDKAVVMIQPVDDLVML
jgi:nitrogen regulatory protein PII